MSRVSVQLLAILAFTFVLFVAWDFSQRMLVTFRLNQAELELDQRIAEAVALRDQLRERRQYVQTDQFIEDDVRRRHWVRDGETLMIPMVTPAPPPPVTLLAPPPAPDPPFWETWYEFLFGP